MTRFTTVLFERAGDKVLQQWIAENDQQYTDIRTSLKTLGHEFNEGSLLAMPLFSLSLSGDDNYDANLMTIQEIRDVIEEWMPDADISKFDDKMDELFNKPDAPAYKIDDGDSTAEIACSYRPTR